MERWLTKAGGIISGVSIFWLLVHYAYFNFIDVMMNSKFLLFSSGYLSRAVGNNSFMITYIESQIVFFLLIVIVAIYSGYLISKKIIPALKQRFLSRAH